MKLYATVTSERASKGQGGNDYLVIDIGDGERNKTMEINVRNGKVHITQFSDIWPLTVTYKATKGEKQKGECVHGHVVRETCTDACRTE